MLTSRVVDKPLRRGRNVTRQHTWLCVNIPLLNYVNRLPCRTGDRPDKFNGNLWYCERRKVKVSWQFQTETLSGPVLLHLDLTTGSLKSLRVWSIPVVILFRQLFSVLGSDNSFPFWVDPVMSVCHFHLPLPLTKYTSFGPFLTDDYITFLTPGTLVCV